MMNLTAYLDETGRSEDDRQNFVGMAGLLAASNNWERFEKQWKSILKKFKIPFFHMKDFAHSKDVFKGWSEQKRRELLGELMQTIRDCHALPFGCIIPLEFYRKYPKHLQITARNPYYLAFIGCSALLGNYIHPARAFNETITTIFAEQIEFQHFAMEVFELVKKSHPSGRLLNSAIFRPMRTFVPLQAADLVAYEAYKEADRMLYKPKDKPRWGWTALVDIKNSSASGLETFYFHNEETIAFMMQTAKEALTNSMIGKKTTIKVYDAPKDNKNPTQFDLFFRKQKGDQENMETQNKQSKKYWKIKWSRNNKIKKD